MPVTRQLLEDYKKNKDDQLYQAVMEIIVKANENRLKEGKRDMCNALLELMKEELDEKRQEGEALGENRINQLILKLSELNRTDEILKAAADREYQKKLLKEFGLLKSLEHMKKTQVRVLQHRSLRFSHFLF